jgi:hypothetical protein
MNEEKIEMSVIRGALKPAISEDYSRWDKNQNYRKETVAYLNKTRKPVSVQEVANALGCAWVTAKAILSDLALEGKVKFYSHREGYAKLFMINEEWLNARAAEKVT